MPATCGPPYERASELEVLRTLTLGIRLAFIGTFQVRPVRDRHSQGHSGLFGGRQRSPGRRSFARSARRAMDKWRKIEELNHRRVNGALGFEASCSTSATVSSKMERHQGLEPP